MRKITSIATGFCLAFAALGLSAATATAGLIDNGTTTIDMDQNLEWLDLTESTSRSYSDVAGHFGVGGDFEGWRHATITEVFTLFSNAGFTPNFDTSSATPTQMADMQTLVHLFGPTFTVSGSVSGTFAYSYGFLDDLTAPSEVGYGTLRYDDRDYGTGPFAKSVADTGIDIWSTGTSESIFGNWLVRDYAAVPEPTALALLATGLIGMGMSRRRRTRKAAA